MNREFAPCPSFAKDALGLPVSELDEGRRVSRKKHRTRVVVLLATVMSYLPVFSSSAHATPFTDLAAFSAATGPLVFVDFNGPNLVDIGNTYAALGVTFSPGNRVEPCDANASSPPGCWVNNTVEGSARVFDARFTVPWVTAVGLNNVGEGNQATLRLFDSFNNLIELASSDSNLNTLDFFGIVTDTSVARITVSVPFPPIGISGWGVDDLRFSASPAPPTVPEPTSMLLLGTGVAALVATCSRRRSAGPIPRRARSDG